MEDFNKTEGITSQGTVHYLDELLEELGIEFVDPSLDGLEQEEEDISLIGFMVVEKVFG